MTDAHDESAEVVFLTVEVVLTMGVAEGFSGGLREIHFAAGS